MAWIWKLLYGVTLKKPKNTMSQTNLEHITFLSFIAAWGGFLFSYDVRNSKTSYFTNSLSDIVVCCLRCQVFKTTLIVQNTMMEHSIISCALFLAKC